MRFTLQRKDYDSVIAALNESNTTLLTLVSQSKELEPYRRSRIWVIHIRAIQQLTRGIYRSLCASVTCNCTGVHGFALELDSRKAALMHIGGEGHASKSTFGVAFGSNRAEPTERWEQFHASSTRKNNDPPSVPLMPQRSLSTSSSVSAGPSLGNPLPAATSSPHTSTSSTMTSRDAIIARSCSLQNSSLIRVPRIEELCGVFAGKNKTLRKGCFGFVTDNSREFFLSHHTSDSSASVVITLKDILSAGDPRFPELDYTQKVKIAYALSSNILPLITTPWLEKVLNIEDIAFLGDEDPGACVYHLDRPFLAKDLAGSSNTSGASCGHQPSLHSAKPRIFTVLSLGLVLVQTMLGRGMEELRVAEQSCMSCLLDQRAAASQRAGAVLAKGGDMYADAVNWCLDNFLSRAHQDDEIFSQQYYDTVVAKLESIMDIVGSLPS